MDAIHRSSAFLGLSHNLVKYTIILGHALFSPNLTKLFEYVITYNSSSPTCVQTLPKTP